MNLNEKPPSHRFFHLTFSTPSLHIVPHNTSSPYDAKCETLKLLIIDRRNGNYLYSGWKNVSHILQKVETLNTHTHDIKKMMILHGGNHIAHESPDTTNANENKNDHAEDKTP